MYHKKKLINMFLPKVTGLQKEVNNLPNLSWKGVVKVFNCFLPCVFGRDIK